MDRILPGSVPITLFVFHPTKPLPKDYWAFVMEIAEKQSLHEIAQLVAYGLGCGTRYTPVSAETAKNPDGSWFLSDELWRRARGRKKSPEVKAELWIDMRDATPLRVPHIQEYLAGRQLEYHLHRLEKVLKVPIKVITHLPAANQERTQ